MIFGSVRNFHQRVNQDWNQTATFVQLLDIRTRHSRPANRIKSVIAKISQQHDPIVSLNSVFAFFLNTVVHKQFPQRKLLSGRERKKGKNTVTEVLTGLTFFDHTSNIQEEQTSQKRKDTVKLFAKAETTFNKLSY